MAMMACLVALRSDGHTSMSRVRSGEKLPSGFPKTSHNDRTFEASCDQEQFLELYLNVQMNRAWMFADDKQDQD